MNAILALILLSQTGGETTISDSINDKFATPPPATLEPQVDEGPAPPSSDGPAARNPIRGTLTADTPSMRPRPSQAVASGGIPRAPVQPAPAANSEVILYATQIWEGVLALDEQAQPKFRKTKLVEAVSRTMDVQAQATAIGAYWDLAMHIGRLRFAQDKVSFLSQLPAPNDQAERAVLESALADAEVHEAGAQDELLAAQYRLVRTSGIAADGTLPWPADLPLVSAYRTNYETFFAQRTAPLEVRHIHQSLPGKLRLIERCATAVSAAENATDVLQQAYKAGRAPVTSLLESVERQEQARHTFLTAVVDYNDRIAEYSLAAVGPSIGPETLVTTLIKAPAAAANMASVPREVRQANVETAPTATIQFPR